jgi:hypothetical protein
MRTMRPCWRGLSSSSRGAACRRKLLARARRFNATLLGRDGVPFAALAQREGVSRSYFTRVVCLSYFAPISPRRSSTGASRAIWGIILISLGSFSTQYAAAGPRRSSTAISAHPTEYPPHRKIGAQMPERTARSPDFCFSTAIPRRRSPVAASQGRTHSEAQVAQIAGSIREFGFTNPG